MQYLLAVVGFVLALASTTDATLDSKIHLPGITPTTLPPQITSFATTVAPTTMEPFVWSLTKKEEMLVLDEHNFGRARVSPEASNMNKLEWEIGVRDIAQQVVDTCTYHINLPRRLADRRYVAEVTGLSDDVDFRLNDFVHNFVDFGEVYNSYNGECGIDEDKCSVYRIVTTARLIKVGCAQQLCETLHDDVNDVLRTNSIYWKCYYLGDGPIADAIIPYRQGEACSTCDSGSSWCNQNLCDSICNYLWQPCSCSIVCGIHEVIDANECRCKSDAAYHKYCTDRGFQQCPDDATINPYTCECVCAPGYYESSGRCQDINECDVDMNACAHLCINNVGSFTCGCNTGYQLNEDERTCNDFDECAENNGKCDHTCVNTIGSYHCECDEEFILSQDGNLCKSLYPPVSIGGDVARLIGPQEINVTACMSEAGLDCEHRCLNDTDGDYFCECNHGYILASDKQRCNDIDECRVQRGACEYKCVNTVGSYHCQCPYGYILRYNNHNCQLDVCNGSNCYGRGYLNESCGCHCADGFTGNQCETNCSVSETECWEEPTQLVPEYDEAYCPVQCKECACFDAHNVCENGGQLKWSEDHCKCFCPIPWAGRSCQECNLYSCVNGGVLDSDNCRCDWPIRCLVNLVSINP
ncbi:uncharacterized protein LOC102803550 [Saccoglossus kowalevskii]